MKTMLITALAIVAAVLPAWAQSARVKDFVEVDGARTNKIIGEGLVTGLAGTGDSPKSITVDILKNFLQNHAGFTVGANSLTTKSVALVTVEAELPPFQASGTTIDVRVSVIGDAKSLNGGTLLLTPLRSPRVKAEDPTVFALASGPLVLDGPTALTTASIPSGGRIEKTFEHNNRFVKESEDGTKYILLHLNRTDFTMANAVADAVIQSAESVGMSVDEAKNTDLARAVDGGTIMVKIPQSKENDYTTNPVKFVSNVLDINIALVSVDKARVIINDKTKVIAVTGEVMVKKGQASKAGILLPIKDEQTPLMTILQDPFLLKACTPQDLIDLVKELNNLGLIKGEVISR